MKLSILIPTINERRQSFKDLVLELTKQAIDGFYEEEIEIITFCDHAILSIGEKRNRLLQRANGDYVSFIDDDDMVVSNYVEWGIKTAASGMDCASLIGVYTVDGKNPELFEHSIKYKEYRTAPPTNGIKYERYPNHLNFIKRDIAQKFTFPNLNHGEDTDFATKIFESGLIKTEFPITEILYRYQYKNK